MTEYQIAFALEATGKEEIMKLEEDRAAMRCGEDWDALMAKYRIHNITDAPAGGWSVRSTSGNVYHVDSRARIDRSDGGMYFTMTCTCPARKQCRHTDAVMDMRYAEELANAQGGDPDGMEIIERTI